MPILYRMSPPPAKKRCQSNEEDIREFKEYWTEKFGMIMKDDKALCIFCSDTVVCRTSSVGPVPKVIAQHGKPLCDGEYIKEAWLECAPYLFDNFSEKKKIIQRIKDLPVSRKTVKDRILKLERNTAEQLTKDLSSCKFFSICVDESTDITSSARLAIYSRFSRGDEVCEEMVALASLPELTTGAEICKTVVNEFSTRQIDISKVVSVTTDGAPNMTGEKAGFVNLFAKSVGHPLIGFHCIIHEEALCANAGLKELQEVMQTVTKVVNYICGRPLNKRQFQTLLDEIESVYKGLKMYNHVHFCEHLNELNIKLQGSGKTLDVMFCYIKAFEMKLKVFKRDVDNERFRYFPNLKRYISDLKDDRTDHKCLQKLFVNIIESTVWQFSTRFAKFRELEDTVKFIKIPDSIKMDEQNLQMFPWIDMDDFEMQLIEFQSSSIWKQKFVDFRVDLENIERERLEMKVTKKNAENEVLRTWNTIPENYVFKKPSNSIANHVFVYICLRIFVLNYELC
ncbi:general transcription factor II-I repeat domain-containing protein 2A-like [Procambarus clarkii]|uniref:general transcription factor II-I repeat domain-containing protein 2A-like n=1 Tax=Procambarus clarkii TaxID=6728 RepID=UPI0037444124